MMWWSKDAVKDWNFEPLRTWVIVTEATSYVSVAPVVITGHYAYFMRDEKQLASQETILPQILHVDRDGRRIATFLRCVAFYEIPPTQDVNPKPKTKRVKPVGGE